MKIAWLEPNESDVRNRHSKATGLAATRGGLIFIDAAAYKPASFSSFVPGGASMQVTFIAPAIASETMLTVNSLVARMFLAVSLSRRSGCDSAEIKSSGGS